MTRSEIEQIIMTSGERLYSRPSTGKRQRNIRSGEHTASLKPVPRRDPTGIREMISRTARMSPEVMVKISGGGRNMRHIKAHFDYISRDGKVAIEDENGDIYLGRESLKELRDAWAKGGIGIPLEGEGRKEAFNVVLSMPPGTDREGVKAAVRGFASEQFRNHQYAFAAHEDEDHPHVHLTIKAMDRHGIRLNPRKGDLRFWREQFARKLREQGIEANATPRRARGVVQKAEKQALRHMENEFKEGKRQVPPRSFQAQRQDAELEADIGTKHLNPLHDRISSVRKQTLKAYGEIARTLAAGDDEDKRLALEIVRFVQTMPATITKHEELVQRLREKKNMHAEPEKTGIPGHDRTKPGVDYSR